MTRGRATLLVEAGKLYGLDLQRLSASVQGVRRYVRDLRKYRTLQEQGGNGLAIEWRKLRPFLADSRNDAGSFDAEYLYQDWWVAQQVFLNRPSRHVDIGSRLDGFVSHLLVFCDVDYVDIRPTTLDISQFSAVTGDARNLHYASGSVESLSCLHVIEHVGLGRYGDPIDPDGHWRVAAEICRVVAPGGVAYISSPIGRERVEFNGQRVLSPKTILEMFQDLTLTCFSVIDDAGRFHEEADPDEYLTARDACGIFVLVR